MGRILRIFLLLLVLGGAGVGGWFWLHRPLEIQTTQPSRGPAVIAVYATGVVEPVRWAKVGPPVTGRIKEIFARDNDAVSEGQPLAQLDDREALARVAELEAREKYWREELNRQSALQARGYASVDAREKAASERAQAGAALEQARRRLDDLTLRAPLAGVVLRQDKQPGEISDNKDALFWIGPPKPLWVIADVDEQDVARLAPGQKALMRADAFPDRALEGVVAEITAKGDPILKSFRARIRLPDETPLLIGMTVEINIIVGEQRDAQLIPVSALDGSQVWVVKDGVARARRLKLGVQGGGKVQVLDGLNDATLLVDQPPKDITEGRALRFAPQPAAASGS